MSLPTRFHIVCVLAAGALLGGQARAGNEGQDDLDKATEAKLSVSTLIDLTNVIRLCESALEKGLDEDNTKFANKLLASTLTQRGLIVSKTIFKSMPPDPRWPQFRRLALEDLEKAVKIDPEQPQALHVIAQLNLLPGGDEKRAAEALDESIRLSKEQPDLRAQTLTLRAGLEKDKEKQLADLDEAVRIAPGDTTALRTRGLLLADMGKSERALADFQAAIKLDPEHVAAYEAQAQVLTNLKRYDEALASIEQARKRAPDSVAPLFQRARIHTLQSKPQAALEDLNQAHALKPGNVLVLLMRASVYQDLKEVGKALNDVDKALELKPDFAPARRIRAMMLAGSGQLDEAIADLEKLSKTSPDDLEVRLQLAMFYTAEKRPRKAIKIYTAILADDPDQWRALRGRGDALLNVGKHAEAVADYDKARGLEPKEPGIFNNLAWVLATSPDDQLRDGKRAIELATEACRLTEYKAAHILSTLAAAYAEAGDFQTAIKWSKTAVELSDREQKEALTKELKSYQDGKPWREKFTTPEAEDPEESQEEKPRRPELDDPATPLLETPDAEVTAPEDAQPEESEED